MTFDEQDVNRDQSGRFDDKVGSPSGIALQRQWPEQFKRLANDELVADGIFHTVSGHMVLMKAEPAHAARHARNLIQGVWQEKHLAGHHVARIRPVGLPWSPGARDAYFDGKMSGTLVLEHMHPMKTYISTMFDRFRDGTVHDGPSMLDYLRSTHERQTVFTIISKAEDNAVSLAGYRSAVPESGDAWERYEAADIDRNAFMTLTDDPRWAGHQKV